MQQPNRGVVLGCGIGVWYWSVVLECGIGVWSWGWIPGGVPMFMATSDMSPVGSSKATASNIARPARRAVWGALFVEVRRRADGLKRREDGAGASGWCEGASGWCEGASGWCEGREDE
eukprot:2682662-Prymnesium_polylepis.1